MPESQLRQRIRTALRREFPGALVIGWPANQWTGAGWPDLLYSEWPLLVGFEVKQGRYSKPTPVQQARHEWLHAHHVPVFVTHEPSEAVGTIRTLKERLPMAFDPSLLAELDAALNASPEPEPVLSIATDPPLTPEMQAAAQEAFVNGSAPLEELPSFDDMVLDPDKPAPDIEDLTAAVIANAEIALAEAEVTIEAEVAQIEVLVLLTEAINRLTVAIEELRVDLNADIEEDGKHVVQTAEAPAPRTRRSRRSS